MLNSKLIKDAHKMTKEIKAQYPTVTYSFQLGLCVSYLLKGVKMVEVTMAAITQGSEKQIAWAEKIRDNNIKILTNEVNELTVRMIKDSPNFKPLVDKLTKALVELQNDTTHTYAGWWIEHKNLALAYIQKAERVA